MLIKVNKLLIKIILILNIILIVKGNCYLYLSEDKTLRPNLFSKLGSQLINLPLKDEDLRIELFEGQVIEAHCSLKFTSPERDHIYNKLQLLCKNGYMLYDRHNYLEERLTCSSLKWNLYETNKNFVWCPTNVTSYLLGRPKETINYEYLAGICYDTQHLALKSIYYKIGPKPYDVLQPTHLINFYKPQLELKYIKETFRMKRINSTHYYNPDIQDWIKFAQYNFSSIIQNSLLLNEFNHELGSLLDLVWWPNLRLGNWQRYESALTAHIQEEHQLYEIVAGISSVARAPNMETCKNNFTLIELKDNVNREIPMYVWNYLRSASNSSDEIVIIGFNSPFYEFYAEKDIVFCADKCQEISWLKKISSTFRYSALGVIFCCSVEDVKSSKRLDGFPEINMDSESAMKIQEMDEVITLPTETLSNEMIYD